MLEYDSKFLLLILITFILTSCHFENNSGKLYQQQLFTFGTLVDISLLSDKPEQAQQVIGLISAEFDQLHLDWHPWNDGELGQVNQQLKSLKPFSTTASIISLIQQSQSLSEKSNGLFNPAIGRLIKTWQFDQIEDENHSFKVPEQKQIETLLKQNPQMQDIVLNTNNNNTEIRTTNPAVSLDFGAFAKGVAIEKMIQIMKQNNIHNGLINAGGDLKVIGSKNNRPWRIGIKNPSYKQHPDQKKILASIELYNDEALFTSGNYERFFEFQGQHYHHIIDPRSGFPSVGTRSVTVLAKDAGLADAASTALFIAGVEQWQAVAAKMGIDHVMLITTDNQIYLSSAMAERIKLLVNNKSIVVSSRE
ncbi:MAG: FAD:protein FMN transferase [gamma proteobacterium symbiont of Taylorina sp.]|nr:FAD:protein FMN transferase [gamma proteobacterium symbiont of Taylorina sp.]